MWLLYRCHFFLPDRPHRKGTRRTARRVSLSLSPIFKEGNPMKRSILISTIFLVALFFVATAPPTTAIADNGNAGTTASFFSGGAGGHADWLATDDQPPGDTDNQAVRLITTNGAPTFEQGYAGILFHHVTGIPAAEFPDSA